MATRFGSSLLLAVVAGMLTGAADAQVRAVYDQGASALAHQLQRLQTTASVLHTGAHPDDEDSALVAYHARGEHARTAYLSLTRGSGGQNIIGTEQADLLGVIRTEELLQARRLDGAGQLFARANDFGFSKNRTEAQRLWDEEAVLGDMVRAIRRFRPAVVISRWSGTPADGHGHHQFAGYLTPLALAAAADPVRFPGHLAAGLSPWQVPKFYVMRRIDPDALSGPALKVNTGEYDPLTGRSYFEIGMQGRSQQKTQQMGSLELRGRQLSGLELLESHVDATESESSVFDGLDLSIGGIGAFEPGAGAEFAQLLTELESGAAEALALYDPLQPATLLPTLAGGLRLAHAARDRANAADAQRLLDEKIGEFEAALALAGGITVDALAAAETVVPGSSLQVAVRLFQAGGTGAELAGVELAAPPGWAVSVADAGELTNERDYRRRDHPDAEVFFEVDVPPGARPTRPYWLVAPRSEFSYDWSQAGAARNQPFARPLMTALATLDIGGESITLEREIQYRYVDRVRGEIRRRLDVVPAVSVEPAANLLIVPASAQPRRHTALLTVRNNAPRDIEGSARLTAPVGWRIDPAAVEFSLAASPASTTLAFSAAMPGSVAAGEYRLEAIATVDGVEYRQAMREISYPHIQTHRVYEDSAIEVEVIDVNVAAVAVGYVMGSGDKVPEALRRLDLQVTLLDDAALTTGDLSRFDTIVIGIRASQTRPAFVANNQRLLDFVAAGGTMIVQYQQPDFISQNLAPFPASMDGNVRVVDETAPVIILEPDHPVFNFPNRIDARDFDGWIQERNNYNFTSFDHNRYVALTESHDDGEADSIGGMLYAEIGEGHYVYTAYSWFRQLPNGVPGAYRIFANLLSLPASPR